MKQLFFTLLFFTTWTLYASPQCDPYINDRVNFIKCISQLCVGSDSQVQTCLSNYKAYLGSKPELKTAVTNHLIDIQTKAKRCTSHNDCSSVTDTGCYDSEVREIINAHDNAYNDALTGTQKEINNTEYLELMDFIYPGHVYSKPVGSLCLNSFECSSNFCVNGRCLTNNKFCRKARQGERITASIKCEDHLDPDERNICQSPEFFATTQRLILEGLYNGTQLTGTCATNPQYIAQKETIEQSIFESTHKIRSFEILFSDVDTYSPDTSMLGIMKNMASKYKTKREAAILQFNKDIAQFKKDFTTMNNAKKDSDTIVNFPTLEKVNDELVMTRKDMKESEIYTAKVSNNLHLALLQYVETKRFDFYEALSKMYKDYLKEIGDFRDSFADSSYTLVFKPSERKGSIDFHRSVNNWMKVKKKSNTSYLSEFNEGKVVSTPGIASILPISGNRTTLLVDFPLSRENSYISSFISDQKLDSKKGWCLFNWAWCKNRTKMWNRAPHLWKHMILVTEKLIKKYYNESPIRNQLKQIDPELAMVDPILKYYNGCFDGSMSAQNTKYCEGFDQTIKDIQTNMLVDFIFWSANGGDKKYKKMFGGIKQAPPKPEHPTFFRYDFNRPRGDFLNALYESAWFLNFYHTKMLEEKEQRLACIARNYYQGDQSGHSDYAAGFGGTSSLGGNLGSGFNGSLSNNSSNGVSGSGSNSDFNSSSSSSSSRNARSYNPGEFGSGSPSNFDSNSSTGSSSVSLSSAQAPQGTLAHADTQLEKTEVNNKLVDEAYGTFNKKTTNYDSNSGAGGSLFDDNTTSRVRTISSLSTDESEHVMDNLDKFKATGTSRNTIFETISESYIEKGYPAIFLTK